MLIPNYEEIFKNIETKKGQERSNYIGTLSRPTMFDLVVWCEDNNKTQDLKRFCQESKFYA